MKTIVIVLLATFNFDFDRVFSGDSSGNERRTVLSNDGTTYRTGRKHIPR